MNLGVVFRAAARAEFDGAALSGRILVVSIFHGRRDPVVWQSRR